MSRTQAFSLRRLARAVAAITGVPVAVAYDALVRTRPEWGAEDRIDAAVALLRREARA